MSAHIIETRRLGDESSLAYETTPPLEASVEPMGFGCPGDEYECNRHCKSNGFTGGYCNILTAHLRCDCYN